MTMEKLFLSLLRELGVPCTRHFAVRLAGMEAASGSLYDLTVLLAFYGIRSRGFRLKFGVMPDVLPQVFVAQMGTGLALVVSHDTDGIVCLRGNRRSHMPLHEFLSQWTGVVLLASPGVGSGEPDYAAHRREAVLSGVKGGLAALARIFFLLSGLSVRLVAGDVACAVLSVTHLAGFGLCFLLLAEQVRLPRRLGERLCALPGASGGCRATLSASAARPFGLFSWSEAGTAYFAVSAVALICFPASLDAMPWLGAGAVMFSLWSVWYQWRRAHSWCVLCLLVQLLFWIQLGLLAAFGLFRPWSCGWEMVAALLPGYVLALYLAGRAAAWAASVSGQRACVRSFRSFLLSPSVVSALWEASKECPGAGEASSLLVGSPGAPVRIVVFSNPYCRPCAAMHGRIGRLLLSMDVSVRYVFTSFGPSREGTNRCLVAAYRAMDARPGVVGAAGALVRRGKPSRRGVLRLVRAGRGRARGRGRTATPQGMGNFGGFPCHAPHPCERPSAPSSLPGGGLAPPVPSVVRRGCPSY